MSHPAPAAGLHLIADLERGNRLDDLEWIELTLRDAADAAAVKVLDVKLHPFGPGMGITGVALLAESHISIHTWPETGVAAVDIFVCGAGANADAALVLIEERLTAVTTYRRSIPRLGSRTEMAGL